MTRIVNTANTISDGRPEPSAQNILGWREWVALPDLGIPGVKAKIDTGARTSALHAFRIEPFSRDDNEHIRFWLHPLRKKQEFELVCEAPVSQKRIVKDSGGHTEERYVIETTVCVGNHKWNIELTLTSREDMMFRMLLGRSAISKGNLIIDPTASYVTGRKLARIYNQKKKADK
jgi:hypothetical protein